MQKFTNFIFADIKSIAPADSGVAEFLDDLLTFARTPPSDATALALDSLVDNLRGLEKRLRGGQIDFGEEGPRALRRLGQATRLARLAGYRRLR